MLVENLNLKPAAEAPPTRAPVDPATPRQPAEERSGRVSLRAEPEAESEGKTSARSRLTYDEELRRVFLEIIDPNSGEVIRRFPPEQLVRHIDNLINQDLVPKSQGITGFLVDQSA